jgi:hypothetical protein
MHDWTGVITVESVDVLVKVHLVLIFEMAESVCSLFCYVLDYRLFRKFIVAFYHVCMTGQVLLQ